MKNFLMFFKNASPKSQQSERSAPSTGHSDKAATTKSAEKKPENPYVEARREWNERYGDYISQARNWRILALLSTLISLASVIGIGYIGAQNKIVPYVVQVDKFGTAVAVGPGDKTTAIDARIIKAFLARFVTDWRSVTVDRVAQKEAVNRLYSMLPINTPAHMKLNEFFEANNPFVKLQTGTTTVEPTSVLPLSEKTWQVEWNETTRSLKGDIKGKVRFKASIVIAITPPTDERQVILNPVGLFITDLNVAQQL